MHVVTRTLDDSSTSCMVRSHCRTVNANASRTSRTAYIQMDSLSIMSMTTFEFFIFCIRNSSY